MRKVIDVTPSVTITVNMRGLSTRERAGHAASDLLALIDDMGLMPAREAA